MMASTYLSSFSPIRQYCPPSNQREYQNSKLNLLEKQGKNVTVKARKFRCVNAAKLIETQAENGAAGAYVDRSQAKDFATVLGIGTANPPNVVYQEDYPDVYFRSTNSEQMTSCKEKMERMCEATMIKKRHFFWDDEQLQENPSISHYMFPSFDVRSRLTAIEIPKLGHEAALRAISDWGQPKSKITHLIFATSTGINIPGFDFQLIKLLGLNPSIKRYMVYMQGCYAGGTALRMAKDLAENNEDARVLIVCCENVTMGTRGPNETDPNALISQALFADGAAAVIVGDGKSVGDHDERPLFQLVSTDQTVLPNSEGSITTTYSEAGLVGRLDKDVPDVISNNIEDILIRTLKPIGLSTDWNNIFWISHPGGRAILDIMEEKLGLNNDKLETSRHVLSEYGNMSSPSVIFVMDAMRNKSIEKLKTTTGDGLDWGVLLTMGPGITVETILLRSVQL